MSRIARQARPGRLLSAAVVIHVIVAWTRAAQRGRRAREARIPTPLAERLASLPRVSVLVPAWNEAGTIESCLRSLSDVQYPRWETIVIAGGTDGTFEAASQWADPERGVHITTQSPGGKNAALTQGLAQANGNVIVALDADSIVERDWLRQLVRPLMNGASAASGNYQPRRVTWVSTCEQMEKIDANQVHMAQTLQGSGAIAIRREHLNAIGGFPTNVKVGVDWDIGVRLQRCGYEVAFTPSANLSTDRPTTLVEFWRNEVRWRRAHLWSLWEHRHWFFRSAPVSFQSTAFLGSTIVAAAGAVTPLVALASGHGTLASHCLRAWLLFLIWSAGRRAALAAEVAAFTQETRWLRSAWGLPILLITSMVATLRAALTLWKRSSQFKGPRPNAGTLKPESAAGKIRVPATDQRKQIRRAI